MRHSTFALVAALVAALSTGLSAGLACAGTAEVKFIDPAKYSDGGSRLGEAESVRNTLVAHLQSLAAKLPADQSVSIDILDIDLAGSDRFTRHGNEVRVLRGRADWPSIRLRYSLRQGNKLLASGEDMVSDMVYLDTQFGLSNYASLPYERRMLTRWFNQRMTQAH